MSLYNMLHGNNPSAGVLLSVLNLTTGDVGRFRDCYLEQKGAGSPIIVIYTRNGGGNRDDYEDVTEYLRGHPNYITDFDDDFDCTYASYLFSLPEGSKEISQKIIDAGLLNTTTPHEKFQAVMDAIKVQKL